ncbi:unnamed protein product [Callosobruchus maculatus]|uniref:Citrate transport protein n=1 Tax=Callosobruchus maculatus TaxID=64391 RepID=A0A653D3Y8_CALMS|nr:unnamed protein product [Callosobruchus maculatus]
MGTGSPNVIYIFKRPWMRENGAAAAAPAGNLGLKGIVAGGLTGAIDISITYPTEYIKTQLQLDEKGDKKKYDGIIDCVKKTIKNHGFFGLYKGLSILIYGSIPKMAIRFGSFETFKKRMLQEDGTLSPGSRFLCGLGAGVSEAIFAVTPMETIKVKFINDQRTGNPRYKGLIHGIGLIIKEHGISGIYKGVIPTILKQGSNQSSRFFVIETLKELYKGGDKEKKIPKYAIGAFGAIAGISIGYDIVLCFTSLQSQSTLHAGIMSNRPISVVELECRRLAAAAAMKGSGDHYAFRSQHYRKHNLA